VSSRLAHLPLARIQVVLGSPLYHTTARRRRCRDASGADVPTQHRNLVVQTRDAHSIPLRRIALSVAARDRNDLHPPRAAVMAERLTLVAALRGISSTNSTVLGTL
jgi:hypothetical protein